jgi:hypothetical protein
MDASKVASREAPPLRGDLREDKRSFRWRLGLKDSLPARRDASEDPPLRDPSTAWRPRRRPVGFALALRLIRTRPPRSGMPRKERGDLKYMACSGSISGFKSGRILAW